MCDYTVKHRSGPLISFGKKGPDGVAPLANFGPNNFKAGERL
jgi:hypothetical protein